MKHYTIGILLFADFSKVLLIKKNKPEWQAGNYNFPGGEVKSGVESSVACINRKFYAEAGIGIPNEDWNFIGQIVSTSNGKVTETSYKVDIFTTLYDYAKHGETWSPTSEEIQWFKIDELPKNMISNLNWLIPFAIDSHKQKGQEAKFDRLVNGLFQYEYIVETVNQ